MKCCYIADVLFISLSAFLPLFYLSDCQLIICMSVCIQMSNNFSHANYMSDPFGTGLWTIFPRLSFPSFYLEKGRNVCTQGSLNNCRDLRKCTAQRNLLFCKQTAENGELPIFCSLERSRTKCRAIQ